MLTNEKLYRFGDVTIDRENFRVLKNGVSVALTPRAFDVLAYLIDIGGRVVDKQEIFDGVWKDTFVSDNALTKIIKEIRKALGDDAGNPSYIETVPKRGYRFLPEIIPVAEIEKKDEVSETIAMPAAEPPPIDSASVPGRVERSDPDKTRDLYDRAKNRKRVVLLGVVAFVLVVIAIASWIRFSNDAKPAGIDIPIDSIAVLPFENGDGDPNIDYLSDGITESLINRLSQLSDLKVMSSNAVERYKGVEQNARKVGGDLNVRAVLTGNIKKVGQQLVINVSLDDATDDRHIWGEQYVRPFADVLAIQTDITQEVLTNLRVKFSTKDLDHLARRETENPEAYQLYLKGNYEWKKRTLDDLQRGIAFYDQALEKDPNYSLAYYGLSASYGVLGNFYLRPGEAFPKPRDYAAKALAIDDNLAEAHTAMAAVRLYYDWDWAETEKELKRAETLDPNSAEPHSVNGDYLDAMSRFDEALAERKRAAELDPLSPSFAGNMGITFYYGRKNAEAITQFKKAIDLEPRNIDAWTYLGQAYEQNKMYPQAIATFEKGVEQSERHPNLVAAVGRAYALSGDRTKAQLSLDQLREMSKGRFISQYLFAVVYSGLGDKDKMFASLEKAFQERSSFLVWLKVEPMFEPFSTDPRFHDLTRRIGL